MRRLKADNRNWFRRSHWLVEQPQVSPPSLPPCGVPISLRIQSYSEHALCFIELVPKLINQSCDQEYQLRDQTLLCIRYMMERMVDRRAPIVQKFYKDLATSYLSTVKSLLFMPSLSRQGSFGEFLGKVDVHYLASVSTITSIPGLALLLTERSL
ncbi:unnamed protein product [Dicrocoelium dendriticum]|nr:unnamed protein product [Dicrocoelium dendriticum]